MYNLRWFPASLILTLLLVIGTGAAAAEPETASKVLVKEIKITGTETIPVAELEPIVASYVGKELSLSDLRGAADAITEEYRRRGYNLARAIVPEQDLSSGIVEIRVLEARIGKITVEGNKYYTTRLIERYFARVSEDKAVQQSALEKSLLILSDQYPDINATASLRAGADPGTTDIVINAKDIFPAHFLLDSNNYGVLNESRYILGTQLDITDPWIGSTFSVRENTGWDPEVTHFTRVSYGLPINGYGTRFGGYWANGNFAVGGTFAALNETGKQEGWGLGFVHTFIRNRFHNLVAEFGFDLRDSKLFFRGTLNSLDRIRLLRMGLSYEELDSTGRSFASAFLYQGLGTAFGGSPNNNPQSSVPGAGDSFTYAIFNLARVQSFASFLRGVFRMTGQVTSASLVASEQFGLGGPDTVKGYYFKEITGDNAFNVNAELRGLPIPDSEILQLALGFDYGFVQQRKPQNGQPKFQGLMGYGPGVRINYPFNMLSRPNYFGLRFDVGFPISPSKNDNGNRNTTPIYYVSTSLRF